jgi:hypothetical protein
MVARALLFLVCLLSALPARADGERLPVTIPFVFEGNQILVHVGVSGSPRRWFILDSGASGCIVDTRFARELGLAVEGQAQGTGAGRGTVEIRFTNNVTYAMPGLSFTIPRSYVIDFSNQRTLLGREIGGVIGGDFFLKYVVSLDFERAKMTVHAPDAFTAPAGAAAIPVTIDRKTPYIVIRTKVEGQEPVETKVQIDSGSGDSVDVNSFAQSPQRLEVIGGVGLGQEFRVILGRGEWAELGPFRLHAPTGATGGVQLIGSEVLRRFHVTFDYARLRVLLTPNRFFNEPFVVDASGLDLRWSEDMQTFRVHDVSANSPAAEAGIRTNDTIVAVGNRPANARTIAEVNRMLTHDGTTVTLAVRSNGTLRQVKLRLRKRL